ncbi:MAG: 30S ribosomal protein S6 [Clostridia bacterium]|nr:30S ribosomal protein S6 [Clostridia bacterium]
MEKVMNSYESLFIVDLSNGEEAAKETVAKFTNLIAENGEIIDIADWGKRRLAYLINDMSEGYYTVVTFKAPADFIAELDRLFNIDEAIMRKLVIRLEHEPTAKPAVAEPIAEAVAETAEAPAVEAESVADAE